LIDCRHKQKSIKRNENKQTPVPIYSGTGPRSVTAVQKDLEIWGTVPLEAARRPKSDLKYILGVVWCVKI